MQAEHFSHRPGGFIIAPTHIFIPSKPFSPPAPKARKKPFSDLCSHLKAIGTSLFSYAKKQSHFLFNHTLSLSVAFLSVAVFFRFFTFGTGVYFRGNLIAVSSGEESFFSVLQDAQNIALEQGDEIPCSEISHLPVIARRSDVESNNSLCDKLLLCSDAFASSCTLYSDDTPVFHAKDSASAARIVENYISSYSLNGDASPTSKLSFRTEVIPEKNISSEEECARLLRESDSVSVISVVTSSSQEDVPFEVETRQDSDLYIGESITVNEGQTGKAERMVRKVYKNGSEQSSSVLSEEVVVKPVSRVVRVGTKPKEVLKTGLFYPMSGVISSHFGKRWGTIHEGLDIAAAEGTVVTAAECGTVCFVSENAGGYGKLIRIDHGYGVKTVYAHLSRIDVSVGQAVSQGTPIALCGNTGKSTGPHLHFEVLHNDKPLNPTLYLKK